MSHVFRPDEDAERYSICLNIRAMSTSRPNLLTLSACSGVTGSDTRCSAYIGCLHQYYIGLVYPYDCYLAFLVCFWC
jgi:hypothetical protein